MKHSFPYAETCPIKKKGAVMRILTVIVAAFLLSPATALAEKKNSLEDLSFIEGRWRGASETGAFEEWWMAPVGNTMVGSFHWVV